MLAGRVLNGMWQTALARQSDWCEKSAWLGGDWGHLGARLGPLHAVLRVVNACGQTDSSGDQKGPGGCLEKPVSSERKKV